MDTGSSEQPPSRTAALALGALGVVYGDIGTSPLYTFSACFEGAEKLTRSAVLGVTSLIFWALTLVVVVKYLTFVMKADNQGEGGTLALMALLRRRTGRKGGTWAEKLMVTAALFGATLMCGDSMITPAISVLGAMEGLEVFAPAMHPFVVPITLCILLALFLMQRHGTGRIGMVLGPVTLLWFSALAVAGAPWILRQPEILGALDPRWGARFLVEHGAAGLLILGSVVLCVTGAEAIYLDMGHFGRRPIRLAWFLAAFPALLANYFGQGAYLLTLHGRPLPEPFNPFYQMLPSTWIIPMLVIATAAAVVASQAMISGMFSLARQAVQLGYSPRVTIVHTSGEHAGQIYVPGVNWALMVGCLILVVAFRGSTQLAGAYGIAVTGTMTVTTCLFYVVMSHRWGPLRAGALALLFLAVDIPFFTVNLAKVFEGGWVPLLVAVSLLILMTTWKRGRAILQEKLDQGTLPLDLFLQSLELQPPLRVPGTAVFMSASGANVPNVLLHHLRHNKMLHESVVLLSVATEQRPYVRRRERVTIGPLGHGFHRVEAHYGFMQTPDVHEVMELAIAAGLPIKLDDTRYVLGRVTLLTTGKTKLAGWRKRVFAIMSRNAQPAGYFFNLPPNRVVELGVQIEL